MVQPEEVALIVEERPDRFLRDLVQVHRVGSARISLGLTGAGWGVAGTTGPEPADARANAAAITTPNAMTTTTASVNFVLDNPCSHMETFVVLGRSSPLREA